MRAHTKELIQRWEKQIPELRNSPDKKDRELADAMEHDIAELKKEY
jgi:hypothetical protein